MTDFSGCYRFYRDILGLTLLFGDENGPYASFSVDGAEIALFSRDAMVDAAGTSALPTVVDAKDKAVLIIAVPDVDERTMRCLAEAACLLTHRSINNSGWCVAPTSVTPMET